MSKANRLPFMLVGTVVAATLVLGLFGANAAAKGRPQSPPSHPSERTDEAIAFRNDTRKLWEDHITWTRLFIVSFVGDLPDLEATTARLLKNQDDIGAAVAAYYGAPAGAQLTVLLREHILGAAAVLAAAKAGDTAAFNQAKCGLVRQRPRDRCVPEQCQPGELATGRDGRDDGRAPRSNAPRSFSPA